MPRALPIAFAVVVALDLVGLLVAVAGGMEPLGRAVVIGTPLNAPFTFVAVQGLVVLAAVRAKGARGRVAALVLVLLTAVSVVSGFEDGSYAAALAPAERAVQVGLIAATVVLGALAAAATVRGIARPARREADGVA